MIKSILVITATSLMLSGCNMGPRQQAGTALGAGAGAIAGAAVSDGSVVGAGIGAAGGAVVGGAVGRSMDEDYSYRSGR